MLKVLVAQQVRRAVIVLGQRVDEADVAVNGALGLAAERQILNELWRKGVGLECMFFITRSLELRALPYASSLSPRAAASFNSRLEVLRRGNGEVTVGLGRGFGSTTSI